MTIPSVQRWVTCNWEGGTVSVWQDKPTRDSSGWIGWRLNSLECRDFLRLFGFTPAPDRPVLVRFTVEVVDDT